jgi:hypothetical protein
MKTFSIGTSLTPIRTRIGVTPLTRLAFQGADLRAIWRDMVQAIQRDDADAALAMDMSVVAQLLQDPTTGAQLQSLALSSEQMFRSSVSSKTPNVKLLVLAGATDIGGNIPVEFLIDGSDVDLVTLYVVPGKPLPSPLPDHDIALIALGNSDQMIATLEELEDIAGGWPRTLLNQPARIFDLERDRFYEKVHSIPGVVIPKTARVARDTLTALANGTASIRSFLPNAQFPIIVRPVNSHAGHGLEKLDDVTMIDGYLSNNPEQEFFISRFVDYSSDDGLFRKYRIAFIDGRPFACHMAIASEWKVWYLNADMGSDASKRAEEARFMKDFDTDFATRHAMAFKSIVDAIGLDYFGIDCGETRDGKLLLFEGETAMIVHDMDPPEIYPYKVPQMRKVFAAFVAMLHRRARSGRAEAA